MTHKLPGAIRRLFAIAAGAGLEVSNKAFLGLDFESSEELLDF